MGKFPSANSMCVQHLFGFLCLNLTMLLRNFLLVACLNLMLEIVILCCRINSGIFCRDLQSYLSHLSLFMTSDSGKFYILVDNRPWLEDLSRPAQLWQLVVTKVANISLSLTT